MVLDAQRILVIEDDPLVASWLCEVLRDLGFSIVGPASSGPEALSLAELHKPEIATVDIQLSGDMDGIEVAQAFEERFGIAVIFLSGLSDEKVIARARAVHPVRVLCKPFRAGALLTAIESACDVQAAARTGPAAQAGTGDRVNSLAARTVGSGRRRSDRSLIRPLGTPCGHAE